MMNLKTLALATLYTAILAIAVPVMTNKTVFVDAAGVKQQTQVTTINLSLNELRYPHFLKINAPTTVTQLTGQIKLNGKLLQTLKKNSTRIEFSAKLVKGKNVITISGNYRPVNASVQIELIGPNTQIRQQTGGSGYIDQTLIIEVE